jgi:hypothetical protein
VPDLPAPAALYVHKQGAGAVVLRTYPDSPTSKSYYEYTFDLDRDCAVTEFRSSVRGETVAHIKTEFKQWDTRWAPSGWVLTMNPDRPKNQQSVTKVRVTSFAADVPVTEDNEYNVVPPEGARVLRHDFKATEQPGERKSTDYEYVVKDGKLVQLSGPVESFWQKLGKWEGAAAAAVVGATALLVRRLVLRRKA